MARNRILFSSTSEEHTFSKLRVNEISSLLWRVTLGKPYHVCGFLLLSELSRGKCPFLTVVHWHPRQLTQRRRREVMWFQYKKLQFPLFSINPGWKPKAKSISMVTQKDSRHLAETWNTGARLLRRSWSRSKLQDKLLPHGPCLLLC